MVSYRDTQVLKNLLIHLLRPFFLQHSHCFLWSFSDCVSIVERSQQTGFSFSLLLFFCSITIIEVCREVGVKRSTENKQPSTFICFLSPSLSLPLSRTNTLSLSPSLSLNTHPFKCFQSNASSLTFSRTFYVVSFIARKQDNPRPIVPSSFPHPRKEKKKEKKRLKAKF